MKRTSDDRWSGLTASGRGWIGRAVALIVCGFLLGVPLEAGFRRIHGARSDDPMRVQIFRLENGLTVYLSENRETPRFQAQIAVRAGSKHDPAESTGLAHYLEHMLFKGTTRLGTLDYRKEKPHLDRISELYEEHFRETDEGKRKAIYQEINREAQMASAHQIPNELDKLYKLMGAEGVNAHTYHEETVYQVDLPANRLEQWALLETERFARPVFRLFQPELEIVYEEKNRTLDSKERIIRYAVDRALFKKHPYGQQTTIGEVAHLKNPSLKNMYAFFERNYVPGNMAITISGDIRIPETMRMIDRHFSAWPARPVPPVPRWEEPPLEGVERVTVRYKGEEYVLLGFRLPGRNHPDMEALMLMDMVLDNTTAGLINLELNQRQRVRRAGSGPEFHNDHGVAYFWGVPKAGQTLREVEELLLEQVGRIRKGEFDDWIIPAIINDFKKSRALGLESNGARVAVMREAFLAFQEWDHVVGLIPRMERLTKADVVRVANRYFAGGYVAGYREDGQHEVPRIEKPPLDRIEIDAARQSEFFKQVQAMRVREIEPYWVRAGRDYLKVGGVPGEQVYYVRNPVNRLFALEWTVQIGSRHDNRLPLATQWLDKAGTRRLDGSELKKEWYRLGTDFGVTVGEHETTVSLSGLDEHFEESWKLMWELLTDPVADPATLEELKRIVTAQREDGKKDFRTLSSALVQYNRYGTNSAYLRVLPPEALARVTTDELAGLIRGLAGYERIISYTGSLPLKEVRGVMRRGAGTAEALRKPPSPRFFAVDRPERTRVYLFPKEMAQAQVRIDFADGDYREADQPWIELYNDYFSGGMSGIVFQELREARALAYSVGAAYLPAARFGEENVVVGAIGCQADKTPEALTAFLGLFDDLPASAERFEETRSALLTSYRTGKFGFRSVLPAVRAWEKVGLTVDPRRSRFGAIEKAGWERVERFQRERIRNRSRLISIVGDATKFDREVLGRVGEVREVTLAELFAY